MAGKWETQVGIFGDVDPAAACCAADGGGVNGAFAAQCRHREAASQRRGDCAYACMLVVHAQRYACKCAGRADWPPAMHKVTEYHVGERRMRFIPRAGLHRAGALIGIARIGTASANI